MQHFLRQMVEMFRLGLFKVRAFALANVASLLFGTAFFALLPRSRTLLAREEFRSSEFPLPMSALAAW